MSSQTTNLKPVANALSRARAGLLEKEEPLVVYYLGPVPESEMSQSLAKDLQSESGQRLAANMYMVEHGIFHIPCYVGDVEDKYPCILLVKGKAPTEGSAIKCGDYYWIGVLLVKYNDNNDEEKKKVAERFAKITAKNFEPDEAFLKQGTILSLLPNYEPNITQCFGIHIFRRCKTEHGASVLFPLCGNG